MLNYFFPCDAEDVYCLCFLWLHLMSIDLNSIKELLHYNEPDLLRSRKPDISNDLFTSENLHFRSE